MFRRSGERSFLRCGFGFCHERGIEERAHFIKRDAERGLSDQSGADDLVVWRRKFWEHEASGRSLLRHNFGERFADGNAERPHVRTGKKYGLGSCEWSGERPGGSRFASGSDAVGRKFYVVAGGVNVGRLQSTVDETVFMKKIERGKNRGEHAAGFVRRERAARKKLAEIFVGELGDDVEAGSAVQRAAAEMENAKKSGVRKSCGGAPVFELQVGGGGIFGNEFEGNVGSGIAGVSGLVRAEEDGGIFGDAEKFAERETAVRELTQKMLRCCWHACTVHPLAEWRAENVIAKQKRSCARKNNSCAVGPGA